MQAFVHEHAHEHEHAHAHAHKAHPATSAGGAGMIGQYWSICSGQCSAEG